MANWFGKKKADSGNGLKEAGYEEHISRIRHSSDAVGWGPVQYPQPENWVSYLASFQSRLHSCIDRAKPDLYTPDFFNPDIEVHRDSAHVHNRFAKAANKRSIHNIRIYQDACLLDLDLTIKRLEDALDAYKEELKC